jgi:hypothetical protein
VKPHEKHSGLMNKYLALPTNYFPFGFTSMEEKLFNEYFIHRQDGEKVESSWILQHLSYRPGLPLQPSRLCKAVFLLNDVLISRQVAGGYSFRKDELL